MPIACPVTRLVKCQVRSQPSPASVRRRRRHRPRREVDGANVGARRQREVADLGHALRRKGVAPVVETARAIRHLQLDLAMRAHVGHALHFLREVAAARRHHAVDGEGEVVVDRVRRRERKLQPHAPHFGVRIDEDIRRPELDRVGIEPEQALLTLLQVQGHVGVGPDQRRGHQLSARLPHLPRDGTAAGSALLDGFHGLIGALNPRFGGPLHVGAAPQQGHLLSQGPVELTGAQDQRAAEREPGHGGAHEDEADGEQASNCHTVLLGDRQEGRPVDHDGKRGGAKSSPKGEGLVRRSSDSGIW